MHVYGIIRARIHSLHFTHMVTRNDQLYEDLREEEAAKHAYESAVQAAPYSEIVWYNLGYFHMTR
jgi:hypothetical protein